jgi:hypothetical protein
LDGGNNDANFQYAEAVGALLWIARCSHPEIMYAVNQVAAHTKYPSTIKIKAAKRILRYLQGVKHFGIMLRQDPNAQGLKLSFLGFGDSDFAGEPEGSADAMKSLSASIVLVEGVGLIQARSQIQPTIARSTSEAEYVSAGATGQMISSARQLAEEMGFRQDKPTILMEDNQGTIAMVKNVVSGSNTRHIKIQHHYIRELVKNGEIELQYCPTNEMLADILTKPLAKIQFINLRNRLLGHQETPKRGSL